MVKILKNLQNHKAECLEIWHAASWNLVLQSVYKWWPLVDLVLLYGKVKFGPLSFGMGKTEKVHFSGAVLLSDIEMNLNTTAVKF